jgi:hypothetical protein
MRKEIVYYQVVARKYTDIEGKHSELTSIGGNFDKKEDAVKWRDDWVIKRNNLKLKGKFGDERLYCFDHDVIPKVKKIKIFLK